MVSGEGDGGVVGDIGVIENGALVDSGGGRMIEDVPVVGDGVGTVSKVVTFESSNTYTRYTSCNITKLKFEYTI